MVFKTIRSRLTGAFVVLAVGPLLVLGVLLVWFGYANQRQQALLLQQELSRRVATEIEAFIHEMEDELSLIVHTYDLARLAPQQQERILRRLRAYNGGFAEFVVLDSQGNEQLWIGREQGMAKPPNMNWAASNEYLIPMLLDETYYSPVRFDERNDQPLMTIAIPIHIGGQAGGRGDGVLVASVYFATIWDLVAAAAEREGQSVYVTDSQDRVVAHHDRAKLLEQTRFAFPAGTGLARGLDNNRAVLAVETISLGNHTLNVVAERPVSDALALAINTTLLIVALILAALVTAVALGYLSVQRITRPIGELAQTAERVQAGDLTQQAEVSDLVEIKVLGEAFNSMTGRLREMLADLEARVAERTFALETSLEVSRRLSTILDRTTLVTEVVEQVRAAFDYYHAHIYLLDEQGRELLMVGGTGEAGQAMLAGKHKLRMGQGLVGRAAERNQPVLVADVGVDPNWLPNPVLPDTRAEIAVPIALGDEVLGVLDVQHNVINGFGEDDVVLLQSIASQVAIALQNANLYERAQRQAEHEVLVNTIGQKIQNAATVEGALQIAARELGQSLGVRRASVQLSAAGNGNAGRRKPTRRGMSPGEDKQ